jgi:ribose-phosphate pyrophosphokinase
MTIKIGQKQYGQDVSTMVFNGGEVNVKVPVAFLDFKAPMFIVAVLKTSDDVMAMLLTANALRAHDPEVSLYAKIPYIPYGRQDRVCNIGEAFSVQVMAQLINSCNFTKVLTDDPHSEVTTALINNVVVRDQTEVFKTALPMVRGALGLNGGATGDAVTLVSPDAGSNKKMGAICKEFGFTSFIRADKTRDMATGNILETVVYADDLSGQTCIIVDDLCDGGRTFIELAKVLKARGAAKVALVVTHGIFSKGKAPLEEYIDYIYAYNDWIGERYV